MFMVCDGRRAPEIGKPAFYAHWSLRPRTPPVPYLASPGRTQNTICPVVCYGIPPCENGFRGPALQARAPLGHCLQGVDYWRLDYLIKVLPFLAVWRVWGSGVISGPFFLFISILNN